MITHKIKDSNINNPFSKKFKNNNSSNSNDFKINYNSNANEIYSSQFKINDSNKLRNRITKIMRVIKGGDGVSYPSKKDKNQNHFFSKMLNNNEKNKNPLFTSFEPSIRNSLNNDNSNKINIDKLQREKFEQELRMLDCDDLNNSGDSEFRIGSSTNRDLRKSIKQNNIINMKQNVFDKNYLNSKNYIYNDNPLSNRVKTPERQTNSIWNIFS